MTPTRDSYFCTACDKHFWTLRGVTRHILKVHDGMADVDIMDDVARQQIVATIQGDK